MGRMFLVLLIAVMAGCAVQKQWTATGGSRADGTVKLSYEFDEFEVPQITMEQGSPIAASRCRSWGYSGAEPFGGITRICTVFGGFGGCTHWMVTAEYQCTSGTQSAAAPSSPPPLYDPQAAPSQPAAATATAYAPTPPTSSKNAFQAGQISRSLGCDTPKLIGTTPSTETYQAACPGGQYKLISCEFTNCKVMQ